MKTGKAIIAVVAAAAAGTALGVLFAPEKGSDTRKKISKKSDDLAEVLQDRIDQIEDKFDDLLTAIAGKVKKASSRNDSLVSKGEMVG